MAKTSGVNDTKVLWIMKSYVDGHLWSFIFTWLVANYFLKLIITIDHEAILASYKVTTNSCLTHYDLMMLVQPIYWIMLTQNTWFSDLTWLRKTQTLHWEENYYQNQPTFWDSGIQIMMYLKPESESRSYDSSNQDRLIHRIITWLVDSNNYCVLIVAPC